MPARWPDPEAKRYCRYCQKQIFHLAPLVCDDCDEYDTPGGPGGSATLHFGQRW